MLPFLHRHRVSLSLVLLLAVTLGAPAVADGAMEPAWVEKWKEDLAMAHEALRDKHPSPFGHVSAGELEADFDQLVDRLPDLGHSDVIVELARIVARIEDGHTRLTLPLAPGVDFMQGHSETERPALPEMEFHQFPLRLAIDRDGVWIQASSRALAPFLAGRVVAIGDRTIDEVIELVSPTIRRDNEMQVLHHLPMHLALPELLRARGVTDRTDQATFTIEKPDGAVEKVSVSPVGDDEAIEWVEAGGTDPSSMPLSRQRNGENFWSTCLEPRRLVYLQFNTVYDKDDETIRQFSERLTTVLDEHPDAALVIDLRNNRGGNQSLGLPLLHAVISSPQNRAGQLFTLIGRTTFSAAMTFSLQLEKHTQTLFVGEQTGSKRNHYGDSRKAILPNSNVNLRISSLYWQWSPTDGREWIETHADAPPTLEAALAGEDPAMEVITTMLPGPSTTEGAAASAELSGEWRGNLPPASYGRDSVLRVEGSRDSTQSTPTGSLQATVDVPLFGLEGVAIQNLSIDSSKISFQIPVGDETVSYDGRFNNRWIVGHGDLGSVRFPFLLRRSGP